MPTIRPSQEEFEQVARTLLDLAEHPRDVATTTQHETLALVVPDYLYERWQSYNDQSAEEETPKRRGRPRKAQSEPEVEPEPEQES